MLLFGILSGVLIGAGLSLLEILFRFTFPNMVVVGRIPGTNVFGDIERHPENETVPGVFIFRIDAPLIFANAESFKENFSRALRREDAADPSRDRRPPALPDHRRDGRRHDPGPRHGARTEGDCTCAWRIRPGR